MAEASSNSRGDSVTPGLTRRSSLGTMRPRPHRLLVPPDQTPTDLPKVLQPGSYSWLNQPLLSARSRTPGSHTPTTDYKPPLIVRSMVVTPRSPGRIRSVSSLHSCTSRQKSATGHASIPHSPCRSPMTVAVSSTLVSASTPACVSTCDRIIVADVRNLVDDETTMDTGENRQNQATVDMTGNRLTGLSVAGPSHISFAKGEEVSGLHVTDGEISDFLITDEDVTQQLPSELPSAEGNERDGTKKLSCRRNLARELEKELTFRPELNQRSVKLASRSMRQCVPLLCRLTERRRKAEQNSFSFAPRINAHSVKLAQERAGKIDEVLRLHLIILCPVDN